MTTTTNRHLFNILALLFAAMCIGFAPVLAKLAVEVDGGSQNLNPIAAAFWRNFLSLPVFLLWLLLIRFRPNHKGSARIVNVIPKDKAGLVALSLPGIFFALDLGVWHWSFEFTSVANATLEANLSVIFIGLFSLLVYRHHIDKSFFMGAGFALCGLMFVVGFSPSHHPDVLMGDLMGICTAMFYGSYILSTEKARKLFPTSVIMIATAVVSSIGLALMTLALGGEFFPKQSETWKVLIALSVTSQCLGQGLITFTLAKLPSTITALILLTQPIFAAFFAHLILDQHITLTQGLGAAVVLVGIYIAKRSLHQLSKTSTKIS